MIERYQSSIMKSIWSDEMKFSNMLRVEIACSQAYYENNIITLEEFEKIKNAKFSLSRIKELEEITKHDVIAFTRCLSESLGKEKKWIHYGLTSTDVVDTAMALSIKEANNYIMEALEDFTKVLRKKALQYKNTFCIGRTHGMHAEVTTFGLKWALFYDEMKRNIVRFENARKVIEVGKISGAVGNYANTSPLIEKRVCELLGISRATISTQVLSRDRHAEYIMSLALIASTLEKIATEVRSLSRTEIHEVEESFKTNQKGSSAMPHKKNPISSENICGCARVIKSYVGVALENNVLWHERDISHSSAERIIIPDSTSLIYYMIKRYTKTIDNLVVFEDKMLENINITKGLIFSGRILSELIKKDLSREDAYDLIQDLTKKCYQENIQFIDVVNNSSLNNYFTKEQLNSFFDMNYYLKEIDTIYNGLNLEEK